MTVSTRRVWRASPATWALVCVFTITAAVTIPLLAYRVYSVRGEVWLPAVLGLLTVLILLYAWRYGLHPQLRATDEEVVVRNPFRTHAVPWQDVTVVVPGENGLVIGTEHDQVEAWCVQKSNRATRQGRRTRSDLVVAELLDLLDAHDPPLEDHETGVRIRRARPHESRLLSRLEQTATEAALGHVFPPAEFPYPTAEVVRRWHRLLRDRLVRVHVLEVLGSPVGFVAFDRDTVLHLGVVPEQTRRGHGTSLLDHACQEIFANRVPAAFLWVLTGNSVARSFYAARRWTETDERRPCEFPPHPEELRLTRRNPSAPRRSRPR